MDAAVGMSSGEFDRLSNALTISPRLKPAPAVPPVARKRWRQKLIAVVYFGAMRNRIATIVLLLALLASSAFAGGAEFAERFALADTVGREELLKELVAGADDYFYFHCLHYQNTRNTAAFDQTMAAWEKSIDRDDPSWAGSEIPYAIKLREAVLRYPDAPEQSLKTLRDYFDLGLEKVVPPPGADIERSDLPSKLDPADIAPAAYLKAITGRHEDPFADGDTSTVTATWMIGTGQALPEGVPMRSLLKMIERPDIPNLLEAIQADLGADNRGGFGSLPIHEQLLLPQLDSLAEGSPILFVIPKFVNAYLSKLRPSTMEPGTEAEQREAYLKRATDFTERLPPAMAATHAHLLRHWLELRPAARQGRPQPGDALHQAPPPWKLHEPEIPRCLREPILSRRDRSEQIHRPAQVAGQR